MSLFARCTAAAFLLAGMFAFAAEAPSVAIGGAVAKPLALDAAALAKLPRRTVHATAHGVSGDWEGVSLADVLRTAGAPLGEKLRGQNLALYVRVRAADGYVAVYALAELDADFRDAAPILADRHDGRPLDAEDGPFRIVAPGERRPARWVRQVVAIDLLRAPAD